jgi:hypothetical protein
MLGHNPSNESELESATSSPEKKKKKKKKKSTPRKIKRKKRQASANLPYPDVKRPVARRRRSPSPDEFDGLSPDIKDDWAADFWAAAEGDYETQEDLDDEEVLPEVATTVGRVLRPR